MQWPRIAASTAEAILAAQEGFAPSAHNAGNIGDRVGDRIANGLVGAAVEVGDCCPAAHCRADRPAVGGEAAEARFLVNGNQVA